MKINLFNRQPLQLILGSALIVSTLFISCSKDDDGINNDETYSVSGNASGSQMNPSNTSTATGQLSGTYNARTNSLTYNISWSGLTTTAGLVEVYGPATAGTNAPLLFALTITTPGTSGAASGTVTMTDAQETHLLANNIYYTVSSSTYPAGEIRGQISASPN